MFLHFCLLTSFVFKTCCYTNVLYTISERRDPNASDIVCVKYVENNSNGVNKFKNDSSKYETATLTTNESEYTSTTTENDPLDVFQDVMNEFLFGSQGKNKDGQNVEKIRSNNYSKTIPYHYPSGNLLRAELYQNKSGVHLPMSEFLHRGHCRLNITMDFMQTAVNAFAIFLDGDLSDILRLPASYVLHSARTISMMNIAREKLSATWTVVKDNRRTEEITIQTLELYRPLFKYLNGKEISKLNLSDDRILTYIGTHAELNRHQVGVVASKYIKINEHWSEPKYLNLMNNLLCGVPMTFMRRISENTYLQLAHQVFYHIRACDPLQRRFYLAMMTKSQLIRNLNDVIFKNVTKKDFSSSLLSPVYPCYFCLVSALGKSYSWNARDVSRLGLLLAEVEGPDLSAIVPEATSGITAHVMQAMAPQNLRFFTEVQLKFMEQKPLNILTRKVKQYEEQMKIYNSKLKMKSALTLPFVLLFFLCK